MTRAQIFPVFVVLFWIASGVLVLAFALRSRERAKYGPGRQAFLEAEEALSPEVRRAVDHLSRLVPPPLTPEQHDANWNWRVIEKRCVPVLYAYTAANPLVCEDGLATWVNDPDAEFCPRVIE